MKISLVFFAFCALAAPSVFSVPGTDSRTDGGVSSATAEIPERLAFDFFNFSAMKNGGAAGKALFDDILLGFGAERPPAERDAIGKLIGALNSGCGLHLPATLEAAAIAKCSRDGVPVMNTAWFVLSAAPDAPGGKTDAALFFDALKKRNMPEVSPGAFPAREIPKDVAELIPRDFRENAEFLFAVHSEENANEIGIAASSREALETLRSGAIRRQPWTKKLSELGHAVRSSGVLVFRAFPRRECVRTRTGKFLPAVPAGEFSVSENGSRILARLVFRCVSAEEADRTRHFFLRFKSELRPAELGEFVRVETRGTETEIRVDCPAEHFPSFLKQQKPARED